MIERNVYGRWLLRWVNYNIPGVQLLSRGVIGQYIGKTDVEVKERPRYNIDVLLESKSVGKEND